MLLLVRRTLIVVCFSSCRRSKVTQDRCDLAFLLLFYFIFLPFFASVSISWCAKKTKVEREREKGAGEEYDQPTKQPKIQQQSHGEIFLVVAGARK